MRTPIKVQAGLPPPNSRTSYIQNRVSIGIPVAVSNTKDFQPLELMKARIQKMRDLHWKAIVENLHCVGMAEQRPADPARMICGETRTHHRHLIVETRNFALTGKSTLICSSKKRAELRFVRKLFPNKTLRLSQVGDPRQRRHRPPT